VASSKIKYLSMGRDGLPSHVNVKSTKVWIAIDKPCLRPTTN